MKTIQTMTQLTLRRALTALTFTGLLLGAGAWGFAQSAPSQEAGPEACGHAKQGKRAHKGHEGRKGHKGHKGHHGERGMKLGKMVKKLELDEQQQAQLKVIQESARAERQAILQRAGGDREVARQELKAHREATMSKVKGILTPAQAQKLEQLKAQREARRAERREGQTT